MLRCGNMMIALLCFCIAAVKSSTISTSTQQLFRDETLSNRNTTFETIKTLPECLMVRNYVQQYNVSCLGGPLDVAATTLSCSYVYNTIIPWIRKTFAPLYGDYYAEQLAIHKIATFCRGSVDMINMTSWWPLSFTFLKANFLIQIYYPLWNLYDPTASPNGVGNCAEIQKLAYKYRATCALRKLSEFIYVFDCVWGGLVVRTLFNVFSLILVHHTLKKSQSTCIFHVSEITCDILYPLMYYLNNLISYAQCTAVGINDVLFKAMWCIVNMVFLSVNFQMFAMSFFLIFDRMMKIALMRDIFDTKRKARVCVVICLMSFLVLSVNQSESNYYIVRDSSTQRTMSGVWNGVSGVFMITCWVGQILCCVVIIRALRRKLIWRQATSNVTDADEKATLKITLMIVGVVSLNVILSAVQVVSNIMFTLEYFGLVNSNSEVLYFSNILNLFLQPFISVFMCSSTIVHLLFSGSYRQSARELLASMFKFMHVKCTGGHKESGIDTFSSDQITLNTNRSHGRSNCLRNGAVAPTPVGTSRF